MGEQPTRVSREEVLRIVERDYAKDDRKAVLDLLSRYGDQSEQRGVDRVHLAILKLADSDLGELARCVEMARADYRDVLSWAEYPGVMRAGTDLSPEEHLQLREEDWRQYEEWLER